MAMLLVPRLSVSSVLVKLLSEVEAGASICQKIRNSQPTPMDRKGLKCTSVDPEFEAKTGDRDTAIWLITDPHSPWWESKDWCDEIDVLQKAACSGLEDLYPGKAKMIIKTLRLVYREITEVDAPCAQLLNVSTLVLSGNGLQQVHCNCLPPELEILELGFNKIYLIEPLCYTNQRKLIYLGLSHNFISEVDRYLQYSVFPNLRHLDLSYNNLNNIEDILNTLAYLPHLSILLLNGNPCSLVPGYPDYVISRLPILKRIDGDTISWEDRNGVERFVTEGGQFDMKEAIFKVEILRVLNIEPPSQDMELPINYNNNSSPPKKVTKGSLTPKDPNTYYIQMTLFPEDEDGTNTVEKKLSFTPPVVVGSVPSIILDSCDENSVRTAALPWSECITFNYVHERHCRNLLGLRDYLNTSMAVSIVRKTEAKIEEEETVAEQMAVIATFSVPLQKFLEGKGEVHFKWENKSDKDKSDKAVIVNQNLREFISKLTSKEKDVGKGSKAKTKINEKETEKQKPVAEEEKGEKFLTCHMIVTLKRQSCRGHKPNILERVDYDV